MCNHTPSAHHGMAGAATAVDTARVAKPKVTKSVISEWRARPAHCAASDENAAALEVGPDLDARNEQQSSRDGENDRDGYTGASAAARFRVESWPSC